MNSIKNNVSFIIKVFILIILIIDISYSFKQYYGEPIDGDVPNIVNPAPIYQKVLSDPLGISILKGGEKYAATNRFSCHYMMRFWFNDVYSFFSLFSKDKIKCLYFTAAIFSLFVQYFLIALLSVFISRKIKFWRLSFLVPCILLLPFFQSNGFESQIGIIDQCITYTFFYALPISLFIFYLIPFYLIETSTNYIQKWKKNMIAILSIPFSLFLSFSSPLIAPLVLLLLPSIIIYLFIEKYKIADKIDFGDKVKHAISIFPYYLLFSFVPYILFCVYSFYIGTFNVENGSSMPLFERYNLLFEGIPKYFVAKLGLPFILLILVVNFIINKKRNKNYKISLATIFLFLLCIVYIFLLPFGGYRNYRPMIIRYDTFIPITIVLLFFVAKGTFLLLGQLKGIYFKSYLIFIAIILLVFWIADTPQFNKNECQMSNLYNIKNSKEDLVVLNSNCTILSWINISDPSWGSNISDMLFKWKITDKRKDFVNR